MKISTEEIDAAYDAVEASDTLAPPSRAIIQKAIEAALRVRKKRKKQKREKETPPRLTNEQMAKALHELAATPPKPLTFEPGKSYRTRDGRAAYVSYKYDNGSLRGICDGVTRHWFSSGTSVAECFDLIAPWED